MWTRPPWHTNTHVDTLHGPGAPMPHQGIREVQVAANGVVVREAGLRRIAAWSAELQQPALRPGHRQKLCVAEARLPDASHAEVQLLRSRGKAEAECERTQPARRHLAQQPSSVNFNLSTGWNDAICRPEGWQGLGGAHTPEIVVAEIDRASDGSKHQEKPGKLRAAARRKSKARACCAGAHLLQRDFAIPIRPNAAPHAEALATGAHARTARPRHAKMMRSGWPP